MFDIRFPLPHTPSVTMAKVFVNFPKDKNKQPKCHHWPALYWLCGSFSASLCTHQLDWQDVWFTLNQSASVPEQTFGLIRQHLRVIWCQRRTGTKKQLGTFRSTVNECMLYYLVHIQYWITLYFAVIFTFQTKKKTSLSMYHSPLCKALWNMIHFTKLVHLDSSC